MQSTGKIVVSMSIDTTEIGRQIEILNSALEGVPDEFISAINSHLPAVLDDVVFIDGPSTSSAGFNIIHRVRLGAKYERLTAAIRAGELDVYFL